MNPSALPAQDEVDRRVWAFEAAWGSGRPDPADYLPPHDHPSFPAVLRELAAVDLERAAAAGLPARAADYLARFPALAADPEAVSALARAEARGRAVPSTDPAPATSVVPPWHDQAAALYADHRRSPAAGPIDSLAVADLLLSADDDSDYFPKPGDEFAGFRLVRELGRGAFGRVFLAEQTGLAGRPVALKVGDALLDETQTLAQLQHTNIVPIYSAHRVGRLQGVCMPYLGSATLADIVARGPIPDARAVQTVGARLADGLAHAHGRGVLHRDIKPANVLIADDGTPLLLDFNLAADLRLRGGVPAVLGGTLPYMAPEHLEAFRGGTAPVDARSDIYSLGVVLWQVLTGRLPFPPHRGPVREQVPQMVADRGAGPPVGEATAVAGPAMAAVLARCLHPEPARRYQSARELGEDLQRQLDDRPLKYAREPWGRERVRKFARRNPRLLPLAAAGVLLVLLAGAGALYVGAARRTARLDARWVFHGFQADAREAELLLGLADPRGLADGERLGRQALARYGLPDDPDWDRRPGVVDLPESDRITLRRDATDLLVLLARTVRLRAAADPDPPARAAEARRLNDLAGRTDDLLHRRSILLQRAVLEGLDGRDAEADRLQAEAAGIGVRSFHDRWHEAAELVARGRMREADRLLDEVARADPANPLVWATRGACLEALGRPADAAHCYTVCLALRPTVGQIRVWRARALLDAGDPTRAAADLDAVIEYHSNWGTARFLRGLARFAGGDLPGAEDDLSAAVAADPHYTRTYFVRARVREAKGDAAGAKADRADGLRLEPIDDQSFVTRGYARLGAGDHAGALADFDAALRLYPNNRDAAQNKAHVLAEHLNRPAEAVSVLTALIDRDPEDADARAGRAVVLARLGRREAAHADAAAAVKLDQRPVTLWTVGCAYAVTAQAHPEDKPEAFRLLGAAVRGGYGGDALDTDPDLAALRTDPGFGALRELRGGEKK